MIAKRFINKTGNNLVTSAIFAAEVLLDGDSEMMHEIRKKNDFKYGSGSGQDVYLGLYRQRELVNVNFYKTFNPFSSVIGYSNGRELFINERKIGSLTLSDIIGNLCHEYAHHAGFNHGTGRTRNYKTEDKCLYSVPYFVSENVGKWI